MPYKITTNNRELELISFDMLPPDVQNIYTYVTNPEDRCIPRFFKAYAVWFDYYEEVQYAPDDLMAEGWDGYVNISVGCCYVFRYWNADGDLLDGPIAGIATY